MSVVWMDDPSFYNTAQNAVRYEFSNTVIVVAAAGRFGTNAWQWNQNAVTGTGNRKNLGANITTGCAAISFKYTSIGAGGNAILGFWDNGTQQVTVTVDASNHIEVYRGTGTGSQLGSTSTNSLIPGVFYRVEFKTTIDPSAGVIEVRVNGTSTGWIPSTGSLNTRNSANSFFNQVSFGNVPNNLAPGGNSLTTFNDFVVTDNNTPNQGFIGDKRCYLRVPSADSAVTWTPTFAAWPSNTAVVVGQQIKDSNNNIQRVIVAGTTINGAHPTWATTGGSNTTDNGATWQVVGSGANPGAHNWMAVSENPADDDNSYNLDANPGDIDAFTFPTLPAGAQNISAVDNVLRARKDDAGVRSIATYINSAGTIVVGATIPLSTSYIYVDTINETDPNTSAAWTVSNLNAATLGYKEIA